MKKCYKCGLSKVLEDFPKNSHMADGYLNKCKGCSNEDSKLYFIENRASILNYHRQHVQDPPTKEAQSAYRDKHRSLHPDRYKARTILGNAVHTGRLNRQACKVCGNVKVHAHHKDYAKPLDVEWLCIIHHLEEHNKYARLQK